MTTTTWTNTAAGWSDAGAFTPNDPGPTDVALFWRDLYPETVAGNASVAQIVVGLDDVTFTGTVELSHLGLVVDHLGTARFVGNGGFETAGLVAVGASSTGTLFLDSGSGFGGPLSAGEVTLGALATGDGSIDIVDANLSVTNFMVVGNAGLGSVSVRGALTIGSQGRGDLILGRDRSGTGFLTVVGANSNVYVGGKLRVGQQGNAQLIVASGASVEATKLVAGGGGVITLAEGQLDVVGSATLAAGSTLLGDGLLQAGSIVDDGMITAHGGLTIDGAISGTGTIAIGQGSTLTLSQNVLGLSDIAFAGNRGELILQGMGRTPPTVAAPITGFKAGDLLLVQAATALSFAAATGLLTIGLKHGASEQLHFTGLPSAAMFRFDGSHDGLRQIMLAHG